MAPDPRLPSPNPPSTSPHTTQATPDPGPQSPEARPELLRIHDNREKFHIEIFAGNHRIAKLTWYGGTFEYLGQLYLVRGPYDGLDDYEVYRLEKVDVDREVWDSQGRVA